MLGQRKSEQLNCPFVSSFVSSLSLSLFLVLPLSLSLFSLSLCLYLSFVLFVLLLVSFFNPFHIFPIFFFLSFPPLLCIPCYQISQIFVNHRICFFHSRCYVANTSWCELEAAGTLWNTIWCDTSPPVSDSTAGT